MAKKARKRRSSKIARNRTARTNDTIPRAAIGRELQRQIDRFGLSRRLAAVAVKDAASQMSRLMTGHFRDFSADRLVKMLNGLGSDVTITITHAKRLGRRGKVRIAVR